MKFSEVTEKAVKRYSKQVDDPKGFVDDDSKNLKMYLGYKFQMDLEKLEEKDLGKKDQELLKGLSPYKQYVNDAAYKEILNRAKLKWVKSNLKPMKVKIGKKEKKHHEEEPIIVRKQRTRIGVAMDKVGNWFMDKALAVSIAVNDILV